MTKSNRNWMVTLGQLSGMQQALMLLVLYSVFMVLAGLLGWSLFSKQGVIAAALASCICLLAGLSAMIVTSRFSANSNMTAHVLLGSALRTLLPLLTCLAVATRVPWLVEAGFAWFLLAAYGLGLVVETIVNVGRLQGQSCGGFTTPSKLTSSTGT